MGGLVVDENLSVPFLMVDDGMCFVCGERNPKGLQLKFTVFPQKRRIETSLTLSPEFQGWKGIVHGGIITTILDELMAKLAQELGIKAVTAALEVRFKNVARVFEEIRAIGEVTRIEKRLIYAQAQALRGDGTVIAEAFGKLLKK
jgi:uncharacterized protein (TIGR00369 family)